MNDDLIREDEDIIMEPFDAPIKKNKKKKPSKERVHVYLNKDCIDKIDEKAAQFGLDRSPFIQAIINIALSDTKIMKKISYLTSLTA
jgi:hypothetical protein